MQLNRRLFAYVLVLVCMFISVVVAQDDTMLFAAGGQHGLPREGCECACRHTAKIAVEELVGNLAAKFLTENA